VRHHVSTGVYSKCFGLCKRNGKQEPGSKKEERFKGIKEKQWKKERQPEKAERKRNIRGNNLIWLQSLTPLCSG
jgi:hypothetical protein